MTQVRLGIIGYGVQGATYAGLVADGAVPHMSLSAVCDTNPGLRDAARTNYPGVGVYGTADELLDSGEVDAVVVCVPHYEHPAIAMAAIGRGIHTLVEKPVGIYTKQVAELDAFARAHPEVAFGVMFNQRFNPLYRRIKDIVQNGEIGAVRRSNWEITTWWRPQAYYDQNAWRATWGAEGGGVLVNQAPHQLDLWQWICGMPKSVFSKVAYGFRRDIAVEDEVTVLADYGDGVTGVFITATHDLVGTDRFEILGDQGKIVVEGSARATVTRLIRPERELGAKMTVGDLARLGRGELDLSTLYTQEVVTSDSQWGGQHAAVLENFARHVLEGVPLLAPGSEGINGVRLANAVHLSSWLQREVPLDFGDEEYLELLNERIRAEGLYPARS